MPHLQEKPPQQPVLDKSEGPEEVSAATPELTQTDHLNNILLKAFLQHINSNEVGSGNDNNVVNAPIN